MKLLRNPYIPIFVFLLFLITSCTTDNSITGNSDQSLAKPTEIFDGNIPVTVDEKSPWDIAIDRIWDKLTDRQKDQLNRMGGCLLSYIGDFVLPGDPITKITNTNISYEFRDEYLSKSIKGTNYIYSYYALSEYGIKNNLIGEYFKEHYDLLKSSFVIANDLQYGNNNNQILINNDIADKLEEMLKIYKNHENHRDIDPVLNFLKYDLNKYRNKPKSEIAVDF